MIIHDETREIPVIFYYSTDLNDVSAMFITAAPRSNAVNVGHGYKHV